MLFGVVALAAAVESVTTRENCRAYDQRTSGGSFLSIDPVTTDANTGSSFNRYNYANNNPYKYIDPDGRATDIADRMNGGVVSGGGGGQSQVAADRVFGAAIGASAGAVLGAAASGGCDYISAGLCIPANPAIVAASAAAGGVAGAALLPPVLQSSRELAKNIFNLTGQSKSVEDRSHHIVAENAWLAAGSRVILRMVGMDIDSHFNGMNVPQGVHGPMHTNVYHLSVNAALLGATNFQQVADRLSIIRNQVYMGTFPR